MQHPKTYELRRIAHHILLQREPMTLGNLALMIGCDKEELRYAIESTEPYDAWFHKEVIEETVYEAVPAEAIYGGEDFY